VPREEVLDVSGVDPPSKIERGLANPGWSTVEAIAVALDVSLAEVVRRVERHR
jgi:hypothetical protein